MWHRGKPVARGRRPYPGCHRLVHRPTPACWQAGIAPWSPWRLLFTLESSERIGGRIDPLCRNKGASNCTDRGQRTKASRVLHHHQGRIGGRRRPDRARLDRHLPAATCSLELRHVERADRVPGGLRRQRTVSGGTNGFKVSRARADHDQGLHRDGSANIGICQVRGRQHHVRRQHVSFAGQRSRATPLRASGCEQESPTPSSPATSRTTTPTTASICKERSTGNRSGRTTPTASPPDQPGGRGHLPPRRARGTRSIGNITHDNEDSGIGLWNGSNNSRRVQQRRLQATATTASTSLQSTGETIVSQHGVQERRLRHRDAGQRRGQPGQQRQRRQRHQQPPHRRQHPGGRLRVGRRRRRWTTTWCSSAPTPT